MKGDRFEKMVEKQTHHDDWGIAVVRADKVLALLRKEHAAVKQMVRKKLHADPASSGTSLTVNAAEHFDAGYEYACTDILAALAMRAKGWTK